MKQGLLSFDTLDAGDELPPTTVDLGAEFVRDHAIAMGMNAPRFTDGDGARKEGLPGQITPGNMSLGLLTNALLRWLPDARLARIGTTFRGLALAGTKAHLHAMVTEKSDADRTVECDLWMENDEGDRTVIGTATLRFPS